MAVLAPNCGNQGRLCSGVAAPRQVKDLDKQPRTDPPGASILGLLLPATIQPQGPQELLHTSRRPGAVLEERATSCLRAWCPPLWAALLGPVSLDLWREPPRQSCSWRAGMCLSGCF